MKLLYLLTIFILAVVTNAKTTTVKTVDATGMPFPGVLIIVKSLDGEGEIARYLTGSSGNTPGIQFGSGLYRVIATCPYGLCRTTVRELIGSDIPAELVIPVSVNPSDLNGEIVGGTRVHLVLEGPQGKTCGVRILVRDPEARWEKWYVADAGGSSDVELPADPSVIVVIYNGKVFTREVSMHSTNQTQTIKPQDGKARRQLLFTLKQ